MQDSTITYRVTTQGIAEAEAQFNALGATIKNVTINQNGSVTASGNLTAEQAQLASSTNRAAQATDKAAKSQENYFVHIAKTTVQSALVNKAFLSLVTAAGDAVKQVDLFQNFPASMAALGLSSKDASESLLKLRDYAAKTGISLTEATTSVARFAEVTKNIKAATAEFIGVKNALIAGGAGAEVQSNALEQLIQSYSRGKPQLIEWRSLMVAMPAQLNQVAKAMQLPNAQALGESLTAGKVSMQDFVTELTKLSTGTGPIAQQAIARMQGIEFAGNVLKNALVNGLAAIYQAVGRQNIIAFFTFLTEVVRVLAQWAVIAINDLISLFNIISRVFGGPQIKNFAGEAANAGSALGTGANNANDMADGLGNAADNAAKINKSLASFDKMNVLPDKTSGSGKDTGAGGTGPLDPATAGALEDIFGKIGGSLQEASKWAKIFAGILAGLFSNALIAKLFGVNPLKELIGGIKDATKGFLGLGKAAEGAGDSAGKSFATKFGEAAGKGVGKLGSVIAGAAGGLASILAESVAPAIGGFLAAVGTAIAGALAAGAAAIGVPVAVFVAIIVAAIAIIVGVIWLIWTNWQTIWTFIQNLFTTVWGYIVGLWNTLFDIFAAPIKFLLQFIEATFILIVAVVATALELIFKLVVGTILLIYNVLAAIAGWINDNVIQPVWQLFQKLWDDITNAIVAAWQFIFNNVLMPVATWINNNVIQPIINLFRSMWNTVSGFFSNIFRDIINILSPVINWISNNIIAPIGRLFSGLWDGVKTGLRNLMSSLENIFGSLGGIIKAPINGVIDLINAVLRQLNKIKVPDWVPGLGGKGVNFPMIPKLAKGGIVQQATLAVLGESGSEAVLPLENNTGWIDQLATKLNDRTGNTQPIQLVVQIGEDKVASKIIDLINEKTNMSGRNTILV
jgi:tape measure domain-containing protein